MKALFYFLLVRLLAVNVLHGQTKNGDTLSRQLFSALKAKDENAFLSLYPGREQSVKFTVAAITKQQEIIYQFVKADIALGSDHNISRPDFDSLANAEIKRISSVEAYQEAVTAIKNRFSEFIKLGEDKGVIWASACLTSYTIDTSKDDQFGESLPGGENKIINGLIHFSSGDSSFKLNFSKIMFRLDSIEWHNIILKHVTRESEDFPKDEVGIKEVILESVEEEEPPPPPPPPPPAKPKTNKRSQKTNLSSIHKQVQ